MRRPSLPYNLLKFALQMFQCIPAKLDADQYGAVRQRAEAECLLQAKVLASQEGLAMVVPESSVQGALAALARRYDSPQAFEDDLEANDLELGVMADVLEAELAVAATLDQVAATAEPPSAAQVAEALTMAERAQPEQRSLRHILITINEQFPENSRPAALARINRVRTMALEPGADFSALAMRYSECPTALKGGAIGPVERGGLYDTLADTLFGMAEGEVSGVVESTMGFHILRCEAVVATDHGLSAEARAKISKALHERARQRAVRTWLARL